MQAEITIISSLFNYRTYYSPSGERGGIRTYEASVTISPPRRGRLITHVSAAAS